MRSAASSPCSFQGEDQFQLICFCLRGQDLALPIEAVKESIAARRLTRLPLCPPSVAGLLNLRGEVVAVLDLACILGLPPDPGGAVRSDGQRILLLRGVRGHRALCGLLCDELRGALRVPASALRRPPGALPEPAAGLVTGVVRTAQGDGDPARTRLLLVLDPVRLVSSEELRPLRGEGGEAPGPGPAQGPRSGDARRSDR